MVKLDIHTLAHHLKQERLYVTSEKQLIQRLNADVLKTAERLYRTAWISKQQRINLDRLIITRYWAPHLTLLALTHNAHSLEAYIGLVVKIVGLETKSQLENLALKVTCWPFKQIFFITCVCFASVHENKLSRICK